jgi:DNA-binding MarR family transcriptional regulator
MATDRRLLFLLQRATRAAVSRANRITLEELGVSAAQLATLAHLARHPRSTMTEVAELFDLNKSGVSGMVSRLERAALVVREPSRDDKRASFLSLTAKGASVHERSAPLIRRATAEITDGFTSAEMDVVFRFLRAVIDKFADEENET